MPIRPATPQDEPAMASLCTAAWFDEALFGPVIHPHRHQYPEDVIIFWRESIRSNWKNPRNRIFVATTTEDQEEKIVGIATWQRQGDDEGAKRVEREWVDVGSDAFPPLPSTINRAIDPSKRTILQDSFPYYSHHWHGSRSNNWYLTLCGIHPDYQGQGFGRELVTWGLSKAREENVHASVASSLGNDDFYLRCGFDEVVGNCTEGEGNPLGIAQVAGGNLLFMWPRVQDEDGCGVRTTS
ncbi:acyl-CoA N-acyltransferase [Pyrenochaeta sp. MPI-SDFR-AT-0127]|nr:acyl-CoA N-acyltransferase [Pyrenochaeta sp. MPI-SDFR-AT-0127]